MKGRRPAAGGGRTVSRQAPTVILLALDGSRVRFAVHIDQLRRVDVSVALRRAQARVTEQFLNRAQVGPTLEQVRRERMTECVWTDAQTGAALRHVAAQHPVHAATGQSRAAVVDEEWVFSPPPSAFGRP